jgi:3-oxoacyl-[acyl-carrier protein] reductase
MIDLRGAAALVTGGGTGSGKACAEALAAAGVAVCVNYSRSADDAEDTAAGIRERGGRAFACRASVDDEVQVREMVERTVAEFGRLDIVVNCAGITYFAPHDQLDAISDAQWDEVLKVNLTGSLHAIRCAIEHLKESPCGSVVSLSSIAAISGSGSSIPYAVSKAGQITITKSLARAFAPVRFNAIAPGVILTRWVDGKDEFVANYVDRTLLGRACTAEEIGHACLFLCQAPSITGQTLVIDSGYLLGR